MSDEFVCRVGRWSHPAEVGALPARRSSLVSSSSSVSVVHQARQPPFAFVSALVHRPPYPCDRSAPNQLMDGSISAFHLLHPELDDRKTAIAQLAVATPPEVNKNYR